MSDLFHTRERSTLKRYYGIKDMSKEKKQAPTTKQLRTAKGIAKHGGVPLEPWVCKDAKACKQYVDFYQWSLPTTEEQLQRLSIFKVKTGLVPLADIRDSDYLAFLWNSAMGNIVFNIENPSFNFDGDYDEQKPTSAMLQHAELLANEKAIEVPERAVQEKNFCSTFINYSLATRRPTESMIQAADRHSALLGIETPYLIFESRDAMKWWLRILKRLHDFQQGAGQALPSKED